jgi:hypothetical protein
VISSRHRPSESLCIKPPRTEAWLLNRASIISPSIRQSPKVLAGKNIRPPQITADPESSCYKRTSKSIIITAMISKCVIIWMPITSHHSIGPHEGLSINQVPIASAERVGLSRQCFSASKGVLKASCPISFIESVFVRADILADVYMARMFSIQNRLQSRRYPLARVMLCHDALITYGVLSVTWYRGSGRQGS